MNPLGLPAPPMTNWSFLTSKIGRERASHAARWTVDSTGIPIFKYTFSTPLILNSVGLKVTSLQWTGADQNESSSIKEVPEDIQYSSIVSREEEIGIDPDDTSSAVREPSESRLVD
jgi:hypothetical protein